MPVATGNYAGAPTTNNGTATAPAATTSIASVVLGIGRWEIEVKAGFGTTGDIGNNLQLSVIQGSPAVTKLYPLPMTAGANSAESRTVVEIDVYSATATLAVQNILAGAAGSIYNVSLIARPLLF